jgi:hypothetical protein
VSTLVVGRGHFSLHYPLFVSLCKEKQKKLERKGFFLSWLKIALCHNCSYSMRKYYQTLDKDMAGSYPILEQAK